MELDRASQFLGILAWEDLMKVTKLKHGLNYRCEPGTALDLTECSPGSELQ